LEKQVKIRSRFLTYIAGWLAALVFRALCRTLRFARHQETPGTDPGVDPDHEYIYSLWHDSILIVLAVQALARRKTAALVSRHQDGAYLTAFMQRIGILPVRGSTNRGGDQALRTLLRQADDHYIVITPDGPRGPHHQIKPGIVYLASRTGRPIVPAASCCPGAWYIRGKWTGMIVPRPFSVCWYIAGAPLVVPRDASKAQLAEYAARLQSEMDRLERKLADLVASKKVRGEVLRRAA
jgi:hypothetical protein